MSLKNGVTEAIVTVQNGALEEKEYMVYVIKDTEDIDDCNIKEIIFLFIKLCYYKNQLPHR